MLELVLNVPLCSVRRNMFCIRHPFVLVDDFLTCLNLREGFYQNKSLKSKRILIGNLTGRLRCRAIIKRKSIDNNQLF